MAVSKSEDGKSWRSIFRYTDWKGKTKQTSKRGFATRREALMWEHEQMLKNVSSLDMTFSAFIDEYTAGLKPKLKENTWETKEYIIRSKLLPYFANRRIADIKAKDVIKWQNEMIKYRDENGKPYAPTYLKTLHNQLSCIFNYAVRYYDLPQNPVRKAGSMGKKKGDEMQFWTKEEYLKFRDVVMDKPILYYAFEVLYWTGIREGELLALTPADFDFVKRTLRINKSYQRLSGRDIITTPKTEKSNRIIKMSKSLAVKIEEYIKSLYSIERNERIFPFTKSSLLNEMKRASKIAGVKRIRIHDLRHSHISLLIDEGFTATAIAERVGHESIEITLHYSHMFPTRQDEMADRLDDLEGGF